VIDRSRGSMLGTQIVEGVDFGSLELELLDVAGHLYPLISTPLSLSSRFIKELMLEEPVGPVPFQNDLTV
jgi:hypothetical protein